MKLSVFALVACSLIATTLCAAPPAPGFRAGAATSVITPPLGRPIVGNFIAPLSTNVHDELHARCLVLDDGKTQLALVVLAIGRRHSHLDASDAGLQRRRETLRRTAAGPRARREARAV